MPRPRRICIPGLPHHIVQRGNNKKPTFFHEKDYSVYRRFLAEAALLHGVSIHAYVLMTNHVHLLMTPESTDGLSLTMQTLGRRYVQYINKTYQRTGTLWEGRFKGSVVDSERYCLACYRYIELNPLRAGIVFDPADYRWSSFQSNGFGQTDSLLRPHPCYLALGAYPEERSKRYRALVSEQIDPTTIDAIRYGIQKGLPLGNSRFKADIEFHLGRRVGNGCIGRPCKD